MNSPSNHSPESAAPALMESPHTIPVAVSCPGLTCTSMGIFWRDSLGREHDLSREPKSTPGEVATAMRRSTAWVLREIRMGNLFPIVRHNLRFIEVYECGVADYYLRHTVGASAAGAQVTEGAK